MNTYDSLKVKETHDRAPKHEFFLIYNDTEINTNNDEIHTANIRSNQMNGNIQPDVKAHFSNLNIYHVS